MGSGVIRDLLMILLHVPSILYYILESIVLFFVPKSMRYKDVEGEIVLITGAGRGLGRELAIKFSRLGCQVVLVDVSVSGMEETKEIIVGESSGSVHVYQCDISQRNDVYRMAQRIKREVGEVTILVNNAGILTAKEFLQAPDDKIQKTFEVNTLAHFWTCKAFLPDMAAKNHGHLVSISSVTGLTGSPLLTDYAASKHAVVGFIESLRMELAEEGLSGVKITIVCPYHMTTGLFNGFNVRLFKSLTPEYAAEQVVSAILVNEEFLILPKYFTLYFLFKLLFPWSAVEVLNEALGVNTCMDEYKSKKKAS